LQNVDLVTPARTWAAENPDEHLHEMPLFQRVVMFFSVLLPFAGLIVGIVLLWKKDSAIGIGWPEVIAMMILYAICGFGVTIGFHRLLTHRAFETYRPIKLALAILGSAAGQGMCIRWCATHRRHHQVSDRDGDPHSPHLHGEGFIARLRGFWHAHVAWCFDADRPDMARSVQDLTSDRALLLIDQLYFFWIALGLLIPAVGLGLYHGTVEGKFWQGFFGGLIWGGIARVALLQHVTWSVNSVCHVWGRRPFDCNDHSANNFAVAILSLGEGWHNNHHAFPTSARHGLGWWQFDASYVLIKLMAKLRLIWNVRLPNDAAIAAKQRRPGEQVVAS
jgi:stearoyl-CoA desaturase (Delta-9 desaturase)